MPVSVLPTDRTSPATPAALRDADDLRSSVTFTRNNPSDCGHRQVFVRIDGLRRIALVFGDAVQIELDPGLRHFLIHNTLFWKHLHVAIEPGEHLECRIVNAGRWWTAGVAGVLGAAPLFLSVEIASASGLSDP